MTNVPLIIALSTRVAGALQDERRARSQSTIIDRHDLLLIDRTVAELLLSPKFAPASDDLACAGELVDEALDLVRSEIH